MDKLKMESENLTEKNIEKIAELFPNVITETKDENGNIKKGINFDLLRQELSEDLVEGDESYEFTWVGKKQSIIEGNKPIRKTLRPAIDESKNWETTENLYIEGDNLEVLKILQNSYLNSIKLITLDPPYNRGSDLVYRDSYSISTDDFEEQIGIYDEDDYRLFQNNISRGRFHSDWCSMIYPRLLLARNLLTADGLIFININDNEIDSLKKICNEVFGESNFIATLIWDRNHSAQAGIYKVYHEYVLVYCRDIKSIGTPKSLNDNLFEAGAMKKASGRHSMQTFRFPKGTRFEAEDGTELKKEWGETEKVILREGRMISEKGFLKEDVVLEAAFTQKNQMEQYFYGDRENLVDSRGQKIVEFYFNANGKIKIIKKRGVEATQTTQKFGSQGPVSLKLAKLFGLSDSPFDSPKPVGMIKDFVSRFTEEDDIILDFFGGSSTTAHAIMELNNEKKSHRKYIIVQIQENLDESLKHATKDSKKTLETAIYYLDKKGLPHLLTEIGKERIRLAGNQILNDSGLLAGNLDIGFRVLKLDTTNMKDVYYGAVDYSQQKLLELESNIKEDRNDLDLLYGVMLEWGVPLSLKHKQEQIGSKTVHFVNDSDLVACFEENVNEAVIREIAKHKPLRVVFRDSSFPSSPDKINVTEIFKTISPETTIKVI